MKTQPNALAQMGSFDGIDAEDLIIAELKAEALTIMHVIDDDLNQMRNGINVLDALNENFKTLNAINEVLLYYGDEGVFMIEGAF